MRIITFSKRNLLSLLHKLETPDSCRTLVKYEEISGEPIVLQVEPDEVHYAKRDVPPGPMTPDTEEFIRNLEAALEIVRGRN